MAATTSSVNSSIDPAALSLAHTTANAGSLSASMHPASPSPHLQAASLSPTPSTSTAMPNHAQLPPRPDRTSHDAVKARYRVLQAKWSDLVADRAKLAADLEAAETKRDKLQAEADMLIEQMSDLAPEISLAPDYVDLSNEGEDDLDIKYGSAFEREMRDNGSSSSNNIDRDLPSASATVNFFSGSLFGPGYSWDISPKASTSRLLGHSSSSPTSLIPNSKSTTMTTHSGKGSRSSNGTSSNSTKSKPHRPVMLSEDQSREEEARIEEEIKAQERTKSYNPDNVKVRIGVLPSTFVHPLVRGSSGRSSNSRSPSVDDQGGGSSDQQMTRERSASLSSDQRPAKRARTSSKEKSPFKATPSIDHPPIKEEEEPPQYVTNPT